MILTTAATNPQKCLLLNHLELHLITLFYFTFSRIDIKLLLLAFHGHFNFTENGLIVLYKKPVICDY